MTGYDRFDLLRAYSEFKTRQGIEDEVLLTQDNFYIGGLDLAERVDSAVYYLTKWNGVNLDESGIAVWPHLKTPIIANDIRLIQEKKPAEKIGFDETGAGIVAGSFFNDLPMEPVQLTQNRKDDAVNCVKFLFQSKILRVKDRMLISELLEQEKVTGKGTGRVHYRHQDGRHDDRFWACAINCYIAVPYIVGIPPAAIISTQDIESNDPDTIIRDVMKPLANTGYGHSWGEWG